MGRKNERLTKGRVETSPLLCSFDHPHILAGQGSLGLEVLDQVPDVDAILVPTGSFVNAYFLYMFTPSSLGGAGLLAGVGTNAGQFALSQMRTPMHTLSSCGGEVRESSRANHCCRVRTNMRFLRIYQRYARRCYHMPSLCLHELAGHPVFTECQSTLADGLAVPLVGGNAFATAAPLVDKVVCVRSVFVRRTTKEINASLGI